MLGVQLDDEAADVATEGGLPMKGGAGTKGFPPAAPAVGTGVHGDICGAEHDGRGGVDGASSSSGGQGVGSQETGAAGLGAADMDTYGRGG
jgi:hypothetical protein